MQVQGHLELQALRKALEAVTHRHEMLRTSFSLQDDRPRQVIPAMADVQLRMQTRRLRGSAAAAVAALRDEQSRDPDDLTKGPLLTLIALQVDKPTLVQRQLPCIASSKDASHEQAGSAAHAETGLVIIVKSLMTSHMDLCSHCLHEGFIVEQ